MAAAVVWLHGFGDDQPESWASEFAGVRDAHPDVHWVHLKAPLLEQSCYRGLKVASWGDFLEDDIIRMGSKDYDNDNIASETVRTELDSIMQGLASSVRLVIGGFSMGAAVAAEAALRFLSCDSTSPLDKLPRRAKRVHLIVLNGWLSPTTRRLVADGAANALASALVSHCEHDEQVHYECGAEAVRLLREGGATVHWRADRTNSHAASGFGPGRKAAANFIAAVVKAVGPSRGVNASAVVYNSSRVTRTGVKRRKRTHHAD